MTGQLMQECTAASGVLRPAGFHHFEQWMFALLAIHGVMGHVAG